MAPSLSPCGGKVEEATGPWLGAAVSGTAIPAAIWWLTEVICGCKELSKLFSGCLVATAAIWRGCGASECGWMTWAAVGGNRAGCNPSPQH
ncbi:unnamed protein product [Prunus armeniaca]|uniref:Uncharacterized protein n=1 Tax=Prunus armeniaca TaxID=36596 RepID=A0A6J5TYL4_PRUAR|nr:unnamed protein product [Prunus armeniaca]